jgi:hypothetical protein
MDEIKRSQAQAHHLEFDKTIMPVSGIVKIRPAKQRPEWSVEQCFGF